jgi:hypothetical protein
VIPPRPLVYRMFGAKKASWSTQVARYAAIRSARCAAAPLQHQARGSSDGGAVLQLANNVLGDIAHGINRADHLLLPDTLLYGSAEGRSPDPNMSFVTLTSRMSSKYSLAEPSSLVPAAHSGVANSRYLQKALASCIWRGVRHSASNKRGDATTTQMHFARDVATFRRLAL